MKSIISTVKQYAYALSRFRQEQDLRVLLVLILVVSVISGAIYFRRIVYPTNNDYSLHVLFTQLIIDKQYQAVPLNNLSHPALQILLAAIHYMTFRKVGLYASLILLQTAAQVLTALILYFWFGVAEGKKWNWIRAFWATSLTIVAPVTIITLLDGRFYFGYIGLANYHNPTIHLLRPVALLSFIHALSIFKQSPSSNLDIGTSALLIILSALIKPNYAVCILPALGVMTLLHLYWKKPIDWRKLVFGFFLPACSILLVQWIVTYLMVRGDDAGIVLDPFAVERAFSEYLIPKFILSILFPLSVYFIYFRQVARDTDFQLSWLCFLVGAAQLYLLAEEGDRFYHGNFRWGAQVTLFLLFTVVARYLLRAKIRGKSFRIREKVVLYGVYLAHIVAGIAYYIHVFISPDYG